MKYIQLFLMILLITPTVLLGQVDDKRMLRDIEVAENVLHTLLEDLEDERPHLRFSNNINGSFIDDYGVIFSIPNYTRSSKYISVGGNRYSIATGEGSVLEGVVVVNKDDESLYTLDVDNARVNKLDLDSLYASERKHVIELIKTFLADYGTLIGQLDSDHRIMVTNSNTRFEWHNSSRKSQNQLNVEVSVKDLEAHKKGNLSRDALMSKIKVTDVNRESSKSKDLELFSGIIERLYRSDLSDTYYTNLNVYYERLNDFGAIFKMKVYSSTGDGDNHKVITINKSGLTQAERDEIVKNMYPDFVASLKENLVQYGKTINTLKENELLMMQVRLTTCRGCNIPREIELSVKQDVLNDFNRGKLSQKEAISKITVREGSMQ